ncbi:hypothetical protein GCM10008938_52040 [Deinococcus roseus]|uniref:Uncharacterized protein n=1 Tax=Deinococcus roseus TaxID=392414 RepID=A0ABQ2DN34_9DEIO|nr:hypothetical protein GCM10008938_52040 [Deinococcus roseus]
MKHMLVFKHFSLCSEKALDAADRPDHLVRSVSLPQALWNWTLENPVLLALTGLLAGALLRFGAGLPDSGDLVWLLTLLVGGLPVVYRTVRGMLQGNFASDGVAMLAIVVAVGMNPSFAGLVISNFHGSPFLPGRNPARFTSPWCQHRVTKTLPALTRADVSVCHRPWKMLLLPCPTAKTDSKRKQVVREPRHLMCRT